MAMDMRPCAECGTPFAPVRGNQRYCSSRCRVKHRQEHPFCARLRSPVRANWARPRASLPVVQTHPSLLPRVQTCTPRR